MGGEADFLFLGEEADLFLAGAGDGTLSLRFLGWGAFLLLRLLGVILLFSVSFVIGFFLVAFSLSLDLGATAAATRAWSLELLLELPSC